MKRLSLRNILVPIDFSKMSVQAIGTAKRLAQRFDANIHLVHVYEFYRPSRYMAPTPPLMPFSVVTFERYRTGELDQRLRALAKKHGLPSEGTCHVESGTSPFNEICAIARDLPADLIVISTHGYTGLKHVFLGSTAERVVQHSPCPVFVARQSERRSKTRSAPRMNTILVPVDFSECSLEGLDYAIAFADRVGAKLILFHAVQLAPYTSGGFAYDLASLEEAAQKDAERHMEEFAQMAKFGGVKFETAITMGPPAEEISAFAQKNNVDLIITSTHGRTGWKHMLIGSTAEHVVRYSRSPVLVIPSHPDMRAAKIVRETKRIGQRAGTHPSRRHAKSKS
jgi:nucleotide-binding universal stress UspA family protein